ncbi:hypothetical protein [Haematospirillum jordaniae]|uniref:Uncharacterized protein n=2 Tax=Haematospirillum jordaniae TaxID=1549855 RepID=A0A143DEQ4_9PROT|nr:hypothetical protein [Haematospirillum jordaniae]AMW35215.1 hypothetical protein AY555_08555 [Haematospirillum jordaniae]
MIRFFFSAMLRFIRPPVWAALLAFPLVSSCYVPDDFLMEIRVGKNGDYGIIYRGLLIWAPLFKEMKEAKLKPEDIAAKELAIKEDLGRDSGFSEITSVGLGRFRVVYEKIGHLSGTSQISFPRRGADIVRLEVRTSGILYVASAPTAKPGAKEQLEALGLRPSGKIRVITNSAVIKHNAQQISHGFDDGSFRDWSVYDWSVNGPNQPAPSMQIQFMAPTKKP